MAWTTPKTWASEPLTSSDLNTHLRDNLIELKDPPSASYEPNEVSDYTTTSTSFVDVDGTNLSLTITTNGGDVMVHFHGSFLHGNPGSVFLDVYVDTLSDRIATDDGILVFSPDSTTDVQSVSFTRLVSLDAGTHTFKLQWKTNQGSVTLWAGAGTSLKDVHPQFWVREVS